MYNFFSRKTLLYLILFWASIVTAQNRRSAQIIDSLSYLDYEILRNHIKSNDTLNINNYLSAYLKKGKREKDTLRQVKAYCGFILSSNYTSVKKIACADSIINLTKDKSYIDYPTIGYFFKGLELYGIGNYTEALNNFLIAKEYSEKESPDIEKYIGIIKTRLGYYDEALVAYKKALTSYKKSNYNKGILSAYYAISDVTRFLKEIDSSLYYCDLGYKLALKTDDKKYQAFFLFNKGTTLSDAGKYHESQDYLFKALPEISKTDDKANLAIIQFFIGKNFKKLKKANESLYHLKLMDSIVLETVDINPELREGYEILINHYKKEKNLKEQLTYVERLILVDSIIYTNYHILDKKLIKEYSRITLKLEKEKLNSKIHSLSNSFLYKSIFGVVILLFLLFLLIRKHIKHKKDKIKFELLIKEGTPNNVILSNKNTFSLKQEEVGLDEKVIKDLLIKLDNFEKELGFIDSKISRDMLAKRFDTNSKYFSKFINTYKGKTFNNYINDLRIDYAIERLKSSDGEFLKWSVLAIAKEVGYNYSETFSRAFVKRTGIKPSFFIKQLKKTY